MDKFKFLEHTADVKFQAFGLTKEEAFKNSALAMANAMSNDSIKSTIKKKIEVSGKDNENLLYEFLEELIVLFDGEHFLLSKVNALKIDKNKLIADITGDLAKNYDIKIDIKAITYNEMFVKQEGNKWICQVVLDV